MKLKATEVVKVENGDGSYHYEFVDSGVVELNPNRLLVCVYNILSKFINL